MGEDAAEMRRRPQRAADIRAEFQRHEAGGERRRRAARRPARGAVEVPGIFCGAVNIVITLPISDPHRQIGLADHDGAGGFEPLHGERVEVGLPILELRIAIGGRQTGDVELFLDRHRQAEQRAALAARQRRVGGIGRGPRAVEIAHDDGVDLRVERLDAGNRGVEQLAGGNLPVGERLRQLAGGAVGQPARLFPRDRGDRRQCRPRSRRSDPGHN